MQNVKQTLEMCKTVIDGLIVADKTGLSYNVASMIELSGHISVALAEIEAHLTQDAPDRLYAARWETMFKEIKGLQTELLDKLGGR